MKRGLIALAVLLTLVAIGLLWYFRFGPGSYRTVEARDLVERANALYVEAEKTGDRLVKEGLTWKETEIASEADARELAAKLKRATAEIEPAQKNLEQSSGYLEEASRLSLPRWYKDYLGTLLKRNQSEMSGFETVSGGLDDLTRLLSAYPDLSRAISYLRQFASKMTDISASFDQNNTAVARTQISEADALLSGAGQLLTSVNKEIQSKDIETLIQLIAKAKNLTSVARQTADAIDRGDQSRVSQLKIQLDSITSDIQESAARLGVAASFEDWLMNRLDFHLTSMASHFGQAITYDEKAKSLLR